MRICKFVVSLILSALMIISSVSAFPALVPAEQGAVFKDGMAQQIIPYSDPTAAGYSNDNSEILRFAVYVETDYDTDLDGKRDLVKAYVQVPRLAVEGSYDAPVIYAADPYSAGQTAGYFESAGDPLADQDIRSQPEKRTPVRTAETMQAVKEAKQEDWYYYFKSDPYKLPYYDNIHTYDYFLVRGFAFVTCAGLGSKGSEGIQVCGSKPEMEAFKDVVEWLHGDRTAYTNRNDNIAVKADWSNGKIGMIGLSYVGTMAYEVAASGVKGLETIVPEAGVASWYEFSNAQGLSTMFKYNYTTDLSDTCASRFFDKNDPEYFSVYQRYRRYLQDTQNELKGDYGDYWAEREYSDADGIKATALIVQGLNDVTVRPKHFDLMWKALKRSGIEPKAILHQNVHVTPFDTEERTDIRIGDLTYTELLNRWFSRYLMDVENGVDSMSPITAQSNIDGEFYCYKSWDEFGCFELKPDEQSGTKNVTAKGALEDNESLLDQVFVGKETANSALWKTSVRKPLVLAGRSNVHLRMKCDNPDALNTSVYALLVDVADKDFSAFNLEYSSATGVPVGSADYIEGEKPYTIVRWKPGRTNKKIVSIGCIDLKNPDADERPATAVRRSDPVKADEWHDYTIFMDANLYMVPEGHRLELYIVPYANGSFSKDIAEIFTPEEIEQRYHCTLDEITRHMRDYSFTIDNANSSAKILTTGIPEGFSFDDLPVLVEGVKLDKTKASVTYGKQLKLMAEVSPSDAADKSVKWSSSNEKAATVDQNGIVKAVGAGTANIRVVTNDGEKKAICTVTVKKAANTLKVSGKTANVKAKLLKKKAVTLKAADVIRFADKGQGSRTYRLSGVKKTIYKKYFKINAKTGKLTIGKGLRKGTYQVKIGIRAKGDTNYKASPEKTATAKIIVQ